MNTPFWSLASVLAELDGFAAMQARVTETRVQLELRHLHGAGGLAVTLGRGEPKPNELRLGGVALRYQWTELAPDASLKAQLSAWLRRLVESFPEWESLLTASAPGWSRLEGAAQQGVLDGFRLAAPQELGGEWNLDFGQPGTERRVLLSVGDADGTLRLRARHATPAPQSIQDAIRVAAALTLGAQTERSRGPSRTQREGRHLEVVTDIAAPQGDEVRLILNGPCRQHCAFCSIPDTFLPSDEGGAELEGHLEVLRSRHAKGARILRLTGVDPLASSFVVPLLEQAKTMGFQEVMINSPCTRLSERSFAEAVARALPTRRAIMVPLYGARADLHDAVVARAGAHAEVLAALDHLAELLAPRQVQLSTVLVPEVLAHLGELVRFARKRDLSLNIYLPFPDADSPFDRFERVSLPQAEVARSLVGTGLSVRELFSIRGLMPCVMLRALEDTRAPQLAEARAHLAQSKEAVLDGARTAHQPCAHRSRCPLLPPCSGEILTAYARRHGVSDFRPPGA